jgi:hypothetical protein
VKRLLALLVLAGLIVTVPVGCGGETKSTTVSKSPTSTTKTETAKPAPEKKD